MKKLESYLPVGLLVSYCIYTAFVPTSIAHSLIVLSLAGLSGYQIHISRQTTIKHNEEVLAALKNELVSKMEQQQEVYAKKIAKLEDEVAKMALNTLPSKASSSSVPTPRKVVF